MVRLVEDQERGPVHQGEHQVQLLAGATRERSHLLLHRVGAAQRAQQVLGVSGVGQPVGGPEQFEVLRDAEQGVDHGLLRAVAD
ncbi:hypothetical protein VR44_11280, partial [Streptomyces katrae]